MVAECPSCMQYFAVTLSKNPSCPRCGEKLNLQHLQKDVVDSWKKAAKLVQGRQAEKAGGKYDGLVMLTKREKFESVIRSFREDWVVPVQDIVRRTKNLGLKEDWVLKRLDYMEREGMLVKRHGGVIFTCLHLER
ncbi:MAG: hypothetical protein ACUVXA_00175 [Candidatus Jordarchaeum sp.]|uniref:hypothetical protein n=1 Tax=Candidatus Jordarchaeum sp. TaxID=2823881 RepID=UPI00404ABF81